MDLDTLDRLFDCIMLTSFKEFGDAMLIHMQARQAALFEVARKRYKEEDLRLFVTDKK